MACIHRQEPEQTSLVGTRTSGKTYDATTNRTTVRGQLHLAAHSMVKNNVGKDDELKPSCRTTSYKSAVEMSCIYEIAKSNYLRYAVRISLKIVDVDGDIFHGNHDGILA